MLEILNSGAFASPIIVFVNQKKTADMVAKDLSRAGVGILCRLILDVADGWTVVCGYFALWQDARTARGIFAVSAVRRGRHPCCH